jgi:ABC-2 type transport system permease protein
MPVHDLGYRGWSGPRLSAMGSRVAILQTGLRLAWEGRYLRRLLFVAWIPVLYVAGVLVVAEWIILQQGSTAVAGLLPVITSDPEAITRMAMLAATDPAAFRAEFWARLIHFYFRAPQPLLMALVVGLVAPPLISRDLRSRAWLIYFSRPISRLDYLLGKCAVVATFLLAITALPALFLYLLGVSLSPSVESMTSTWMLPLRIVGATLVLVVPTTVLSVCLSSLWYNTRTSTFAWYAIWVVGAIVFSLMAAATGFESGSAGGEAAAPSLSLSTGSGPPPFVIVSFYHMLGTTQAWIFGIEPYSSGISVALAGLLVITVASGALLYHRISGLMRS